MCVDCNKKKINGCWECPPPVSVAIKTFEKWDENEQEPVTGILQLDHTILETGDYILQLQLNYWPQGNDNHYVYSDVHINGAVDVGNSNERQVETALIGDPVTRFTFTHTAKVTASKNDTVGFILTGFKYIDNGSIVVTKLP
jgi:hypothetical protein